LEKQTKIKKEKRKKVFSQHDIEPYLIVLLLKEYFNKKLVKILNSHDIRICQGQNTLKEFGVPEREIE
jgi:hypothetical protein